MKRSILAFALLCCLTVKAQINPIERVLREVEQNNKELQAGEQDLAASKLKTKIDNNLSDPEISYTYQCGKQKNVSNENELTVTQEFDFPTLYAMRSKYDKLQNRVYEMRMAQMRCDILFQAKELCLEMIGLNKQKALLEKRMANAEELAKYYVKRLEDGDANILETNRVKLAVMSLRTEVTENGVAYRTALQRLLSMNDNKPLTFEASEYPVLRELSSFESLRDEVFAQNYELQSVQAEQEAARKMVMLNKNGWLPKLEVGYQRNEAFREQLNGFIIGGTIPLFENKGKVKKAKAELLSAELQQQRITGRIEAELQAQFNEAKQLKLLIDAYDMPLMTQTLEYLEQALTAGQISVAEYFNEVEEIYENQQNYFDLEKRYQKIVAELHKNNL